LTTPRRALVERDGAGVEGAHLRPEGAGLDLLGRQAEIFAVLLPEAAILHQVAHRLAGDPAECAPPLQVFDNHKAPGLRVEVRRRAGGQLQKGALVLGVDRPIGKGAVGGMARADGFGEIHMYLMVKG
jgi:hypothetical protein